MVTAGTPTHHSSGEGKDVTQDLSTDLPAMQHRKKNTILKITTL